MLWFSFTILEVAVPVEIEVPVAWGDMDALGHVNNTVYLRWFESARIAYFDAIGMMTDRQVGPILARTSIDFRRPVAYPDTVRVTARVEAQGNTSFTMRYEVHSRGAGALAAEGEGVVVLFDYESGQKVRLPDGLRQAIDGVEREV